MWIAISALNLALAVMLGAFGAHGLKSFATLEQLWTLNNQKQKVSAEVIEPWLAIDALDESWKKALAKKPNRVN